jgi:hypothetical protein
MRKINIIGFTVFWVGIFEKNKPYCVKVPNNEFYVLIANPVYCLLRHKFAAVICCQLNLRVYSKSLIVIFLFFLFIPELMLWTGRLCQAMRMKTWNRQSSVAR